MIDKNTEEYKEFMDLQGVADFIGVHINTVYKYIRDDVRPLPTFQISDRVIRVRKVELEAWLEEYHKSN